MHFNALYLPKKKETLRPSFINQYAFNALYLPNKALRPSEQSSPNNNITTSC